MMVEQAPFTRNAEQLMRDLNQATKQLEEMSGQSQVISSPDSHKLIKLLERLNTTLDPVLWEGKKAAFQGMFDGMDDKIRKALNAIQVFQRNHPERDPGTGRNVEQAITSLSFTLKSVLNSFDKNLRDLKKYKIGQRVEKVSKGKQA